MLLYYHKVPAMSISYILLFIDKDQSRDAKPDTNDLMDGYGFLIDQQPHKQKDNGQRNAADQGS